LVHVAAVSECLRERPPVHRQAARWRRMVPGRQQRVALTPACDHAGVVSVRQSCGRTVVEQRRRRRPQRRPQCTGSLTGEPARIAPTDVATATEDAHVVTVGGRVERQATCCRHHHDNSNHHQQHRQRR